MTALLKYVETGKAPLLDNPMMDVSSDPNFKQTIEKLRKSQHGGKSSPVVPKRDSLTPVGSGGNTGASESPVSKEEGMYVLVESNDSDYMMI